MKRIALALLLAGVPGCISSAPTTPATRAFTVASADGTAISGQADIAARADTAVIMVAGTGVPDRDAELGNSGTPRDLIFSDLAQRLNARGVTAVRYDRRGVRYQGEASANDRAVAAGATVQSMRDDLGAVYAWARAANGLGARCIVFFGHSEGMAHIGRLADSGAPAPALVIGMGALLESPAAVMHWQLAERDAHSLHLMDSNGDGDVTTAEVDANWARTPSSFMGPIDRMRHPSGVWTAAELATMPQVQHDHVYTPQREAIMAIADDAPFPNAETAMASYAWMKTFFTDDAPIAQRLAQWRTPMIFHYGSVNSQTNAERQQTAAASIAAQSRFVMHPDRGHTLGNHVFFGPIDEAIADQIADEAAQAARRCR